MPRPTKTVLLNLVLLLGSIGVALLLAEGVLRMLAPGYSPIALDIYAMHDDGVLRMRPNLDREHLTAEWKVAVQTNADGLRDHRTPPTAATTVLGLGDSFAFGWGVPFDDAFYTRTEAALADSVRVVKAGTPATGPLDQLRWLQTTGDRYAPDAIVLSLFVGNDFADVQLGGIPAQFDVEDGVLMKKSVGGGAKKSTQAWYRLAARWLKKNSLLGQKLAELVWIYEQSLRPQERENLGLNARDEWLWEFFKIHLTDPPPATREGIDATLDALTQIQAWCAQRGIPMVLMIIPRSVQVYDWELDKWMTTFQLNPEELDLDRPQRVLTDWAQANGVVVLDLLPPFRNHAETHPEDRLYFYPNAHMNEAGHHEAGALLTDTLRSILGRSAEPTTSPSTP